MRARAAGYSGTPLAAKLGVRPGCRIYVTNAPDDYPQLLHPCPADVAFVTRLSKTTDIIHVFAEKRADLEAKLRTVKKRMRPDAVIWVSWPKKASRVPTDITEETIRQVAHPMGLVDIKVCAVDEKWSGLKLMIRRDLR